MNVAVRKGHRSSSYVEYVKPHEQSRNTLTVIRYANASEVHFLHNTILIGSTSSFDCRFYWMITTKPMASHTPGMDFRKLLMLKKKLF